MLTLKPMPRRVTAAWMAQQWRDGRRSKKKLDAYPSMSLAGAREVFRRDYANLIQKGRSIRIASDTRSGAVADLFEAYVGYLRGSGKSSWKEVEKGLNSVADTFGRNRPGLARKKWRDFLLAPSATFGRLSPPPQPDDSVDDFLCMPAPVEPRDKGAVNLELVERKGLEIGERRVSSAEIIQSGCR